MSQVSVQEEIKEFAFLFIIFNIIYYIYYIYCFEFDELKPFKAISFLKPFK